MDEWMDGWIALLLVKEVLLIEEVVVQSGRVDCNCRVGFFHFHGERTIWNL